MWEKEGDRTKFFYNLFVQPTYNYIQSHSTSFTCSSHSFFVLKINSCFEKFILFVYNFHKYLSISLEIAIMWCSLNSYHLIIAISSNSLLDLLTSITFFLSVFSILFLFYFITGCPLFFPTSCLFVVAATFFLSLQDSYSKS